MASNLGTNVKSSNVLGKPLQLHSRNPPTGFTRTGFCEVPPTDTGNHSVAARVTDAFLDFSAAHGNDLRKAVGLKEGDNWCLCASRWKEAFDARTGPADEKVPRVNLGATNEAALRVVTYKDLKAFAKEPDVQPVHVGGNHPEKFVRESREIGGRSLGLELEGENVEDW